MAIQFSLNNTPTAEPGLENPPGSKADLAICTVQEAAGKGDFTTMAHALGALGPNLTGEQMAQLAKAVGPAIDALASKAGVRESVRSS